MTKRVRTPREENGPDGYPHDNEAFREAAQKVVRAGREDAEQARQFLEKLRSSFSESPSTVGACDCGAQVTLSGDGTKPLCGNCWSNSHLRRKEE